MLRGINVSGQKNIRMDDLRLLYESLGFEDVTSYIQSGNVLFECSEKKAAEIKILIEKSIEEKYGFSVHVEIRTNKELKNILNNNPFDPVQIEKDEKRFLVTFLSESPDEHSVRDIQQFVLPGEKLIVSNLVVYLHCPDGYGKSKLSNNYIERKFRVSATTRNWRTANKLYELSTQ